MSAPEDKAKALVAACKGRLHGGKAGRLLGTYHRNGGDRTRFERALSLEYPGLDAEMVADILAHLFPAQKTAKKGKTE